MPLYDNIQPIKLDPSTPPHLIVVIDTEEEFDWDSGPDPLMNNVTSMDHIDLVQDLFDEYGIVPCYVIDFPITSQERGRKLLAQYAKQGRCEIGAHLHPWVNPPISEKINLYNSYVGNLPRDLEYLKLATLTETIRDHFDASPIIYKAGRYGFGPNTADIMKELGYEIDLSICPAFNYASDGGPDFSKFSTDPFWFGSERELLEIPVTGSFVGWAGRWCHPLYEFCGKIHFLKARAILSKIGAVDRLMLSPEGYNFNEHVKITEALLSKGVRTFTWNFHSPSVAPGFTPYVNSDKELHSFLNSFRRYFDYFFSKLGGTASTPTQLKYLLEALK